MQQVTAIQTISEGPSRTSTARAFAAITPAQLEDLGLTEIQRRRLQKTLSRDSTKEFESKRAQWRERRRALGDIGNTSYG